MAHKNHDEEIIEADLKGSDPEAVDDLLSKELLQLSVKDRNDIQEEIHGVKCLAVNETPQLIEESLRKLAVELDERIPDSQKQAYLQSLQPPKELLEHQRILQQLHQLEPLPQSTYINDDNFRLRFLRCELFDVKKAAKQMANFLDLLVELFGDYALRRPVRLSDFTKEELRHMRKGRYQTLPYRDRSGRRIVTIFPEEEHSPIPPFIKVSRLRAIICCRW